MQATIARILFLEPTREPTNVTLAEVQFNTLIPIWRARTESSFLVYGLELGIFLTKLLQPHT